MQGMAEERTTRVRSRASKVDDSGQLFMSSKELRQFQMAMRNSIMETDVDVRKDLYENIGTTMHTGIDARMDIKGRLTYVDLDLEAEMAKLI